MILEEPCPDCPPPLPEGQIHCCPVWGMGDPSGCCTTCRCSRTVLTEEGLQVLDLVRRHLEVEGRLVVPGATALRGKLVTKRG